MRRWPHPVETAPPEDLMRLLHRQTDLLLEIRALLNCLAITKPEQK